MTEPQIQQQQQQPARLVSPMTPSVGTTLGKQPSPFAVKAFHAMVRKELRELHEAESGSDGAS